MPLTHSYRMLAHTGIRSAVLLALGLLLVAWPGGLSRSLLNLAECGGSPSYLPFTAARGITDIAAPGEKIDPEPIVAARFRRR